MNPNIKKDQTLFSTVTGSHMWSMNKFDSDKDISTVYVQNSRSMFLNGTPTRGKFKRYVNKEGLEIDEQFYEIGKIIQLLKKGNANAVWAVLSPIIEIEHSNCLKELRQITVENLSSETYKSIQGMAKNNIKDFIMKGDLESALYKKKLNVIGRNIQFGINLLIFGKPVFQKVNIKNQLELNQLMIQLNEAYKSSTLPKKVNPEPFDEYLIKWRLHKLRIDEMI